MKKNCPYDNVEDAQAEGYLGSSGEVFIDKITITLPNPNLLMPNSTMKGGVVNYDKLVRQNLEYKLNNHPDLTKLAYKHMHGYEYGFRLSLNHTDDRPTIWMCSKSPKKGFLRFEFNPIRSGPLGITQLAYFFDSLFESFWPLIVAHGRCTRVDAAVDLWGVHIEQVWPVQNEVRQSTKWNRQGKLETLVIGSPKSDQIKFYDKLVNLKIKNTTPITRIEYKWQGQWPLKGLDGFENPFLKVAVIPLLPQKPDWATESDWNMFRDSVKVRGAQAAISNLTPYYRKKYREHFKKHSIPFWQPEKVWSAWPKMSGYVVSGGYFDSETEQVA